MATSAKRLAKPARREQLLEAALGIVRAEGADGLTLVTLAEAAGVSRPIAYDHFGTRSGLLLALYRRLDERHRAALAQALQAAGSSLDDLARVMSTAYLECATEMPESVAVSAALKGDPDVDAVQHEMVERYTDMMATALSAHSPLPIDALRLRCVGVLGAAESIAAELHRRRSTVDEAVDALTALIVGCVATGPLTTRRADQFEASASK